MPCLARLTKLSCGGQTQHTQLDEWRVAVAVDGGRTMVVVVVVVVDSIAMGRDLLLPSYGRLSMASWNMSRSHWTPESDVTAPNLLSTYLGYQATGRCQARSQHTSASAINPTFPAVGSSTRLSLL